jgi:hypothetical protein
MTRVAVVVAVIVAVAVAVIEAVETLSSNFVELAVGLTI